VDFVGTTQARRKHDGRTTDENGRFALRNRGVKRFHDAHDASFPNRRNFHGKKIRFARVVRVVYRKICAELRGDTTRFHPSCVRLFGVVPCVVPQTLRRLAIAGDYHLAHSKYI
jgi:hypothetical protein